MANALAQLLQHYPLLQDSDQEYVLATIIETMGSTYQKAGARMLITKNAEFIGLLGGGCFEADLSEHAHAVFNNQQSKVVFYDMRSPDEAIWGLGLGCNGAVRILLQYVSQHTDFTPLAILNAATHEMKSGVLATICASDHPCYPVDHNLFFDIALNSGSGKIPDEYQLHTLAVRRVILQDRAELVHHQINGHTVTVFYDLIKPAWRLLILGAGPDAVPLTQLAKTLGWHITLVDHRPAYIKPERFPDVDQLVMIAPDALAERLDLNQFDALVLMTHSIDYDERYLRVIADSPIHYIGLLGPTQRRDRLLETLGQQADTLQSRVYGPTGLDIGATSPEEIALSIMAEIHAVLSQRDGGHLSRLSSPIQQRQLAN